MRWRKHNRRPGWDYTLPGPYFITVCTDLKRMTFANDSYRQVVMDVWNGLPAHFPELVLDALVVMPNHVHGLLQLGNGDVDLARPAALSTARTARAEEGNRCYSLSEVVNALKGFSTRRINELRSDGGTLWQRGYWDRIVHTTTAADAIRRYILENPANWQTDPYNPAQLMVGEEDFW